MNDLRLLPLVLLAFALTYALAYLHVAARARREARWTAARVATERAVASRRALAVARRPGARDREELANALEGY